MDNTEEIKTIQFKDRSGWLIFFGIVLLLIGLAVLAFVPLMIIGQVILAKSGMGTTGKSADFSIFIAAILVLIPAALFIYSGIGVIMKRRWGGDMALILSSIWLVLGIVSMAFMVIIMPRVLFPADQNIRQIPVTMIPLILAVIYTLTFVIYVLFPGILTFFFSRSSVRMTFRKHDTRPSWMEKAPLPVIALSLLFIDRGIGMVSLSYMGVFWFFGFLLPGAAGSLLCLIFSVIWLFLAYGLYRLDIRAWWVSILASALFEFSWVVSYMRVPMDKFYSSQGMDLAQLESMPGGFGLVEVWSSMSWMMLVLLLLNLGFQLWLYRYFRKGRVTEPQK